MTRVEVLGPGCRRCTELDRLVREIVAAEHLDADVHFVDDPAEIVGRGFFMRTPGLVVNGVVVAVVTDVIREGRPVVGYGFNSNGRYGQGHLIRERFVPRLMDADPASLVDDAGNLRITEVDVNRSVGVVELEDRAARGEVKVGQRAIARSGE